VLGISNNEADTNSTPMKNLPVHSGISNNEENTISTPTNKSPINEIASPSANKIPVNEKESPTSRPTPTSSTLSSSSSSSSLSSSSVSNEVALAGFSARVQNMVSEPRGPLGPISGIREEKLVSIQEAVQKFESLFSSIEVKKISS